MAYGRIYWTKNYGKGISLRYIEIRIHNSSETIAHVPATAVVHLQAMNGFSGPFEPYTIMDMTTGIDFTDIDHSNGN